MVLVTLDTREPHVVEVELRKHVVIKKELMLFGDFRTKQVIFERKTIEDLVQSVFGKTAEGKSRLEEQMRGINQVCENEEVIGFLLITGHTFEYQKVLSGLGIETNPKIVAGSVASVCTRFGVHLLWCCDLSSAIEVACGIMVKADEGKMYLWPKNSTMYYNALVANALQVTPTLATRLLQQYGTLEGIFKATDDQLLKVYGIGSSTLKKLRYIQRKA